MRKKIVETIYNPSSSFVPLLMIPIQIIFRDDDLYVCLYPSTSLMNKHFICLSFINLIFGHS